jgi:hypothetical protein
MEWNPGNRVALPPDQALARWHRAAAAPLSNSNALHQIK